jgi:hypothetical protein
LRYVLGARGRKAERLPEPDPGWYHRIDQGVEALIPQHPQHLGDVRWTGAEVAGDEGAE